MYTEYFGFADEPFRLTADPRMFFESPVYAGAYTSLASGVRARKGLMSLVGEFGTGKTTLVRRLMATMPPRVRFVFLVSAAGSCDELMSFMFEELEIPRVDGSWAERVGMLERRLAAWQPAETAVLVVDEAHHLADDLLERLRLLSNIEHEGRTLLQMLLVGPLELAEKLDQPQHRPLKQRIAVQCRLDRLRYREVGPYIQYRLAAAGYKGDELFGASTVQQIAFFSDGVPRLVNLICDNALTAAAAAALRAVPPGLIADVARDLRVGPARVEINQREVRRARYRVLGELVRLPQAAVHLSGAYRTVAALGAGARDRVVRELPRLPQAVHQLGDAGRAVTALGAGVAERSRRRLHAAGLGARTGLATVSRAAGRLGDAGRRVVARSGSVAELGRRRLRHAMSGLAHPSRTWAGRPGSPGQAVATMGIAIAATSQSWLGHVRGRALRTAATVVSGFAIGLALVLISASFLGRPAVLPDRVLPVTGKAPADQGPRTTPAAGQGASTHRELASGPTPAVAQGAPTHREVASRPTPAATQGASTHRERASGPVGEARRPAVVPPATPLQVVAIRFGVIDRQQSDWKWSWRVTVYKPGDGGARVNARIEYLEFRGSTRRLVGYEELCGLTIAGGRLESIEGIHTFSAEDSQKISTMTATFSAATDGAGSRACRPSSSRVRTSPARGSPGGA